MSGKYAEANERFAHISISSLSQNNKLVWALINALISVGEPKHNKRQKYEALRKSLQQMEKIREDHNIKSIGDRAIWKAHSRTLRRLGAQVGTVKGWLFVLWCILRRDRL